MRTASGRPLTRGRAREGTLERRRAESREQRWRDQIRESTLWAVTLLSVCAVCCVAAVWLLCAVCAVCCGLMEETGVRMAEARGRVAVVRAAVAVVMAMTVREVTAMMRMGEATVRVAEAEGGVAVMRGDETVVQVVVGAKVAVW